MIRDPREPPTTPSSYSGYYLRRQSPPGSPTPKKCCFDRTPTPPPPKRDISPFCCCYTCSNTSPTSILATIGVCCLVLIYTVLGAFVFMRLEGPQAEHAVAASKTSGVGALRAETVDRLWSITENLNILYRENWTRLAAEEVLVFQEALFKSLKQSSGGGGSEERGRGNGHKWSFSSSFLYSLTLITTIGYGSVAPRTTWGKLVTILYALVGIPLMLLYLSTTGDLLARTFRRLYAKLCGISPQKQPHCPCANPVRVPVTLCLLIILVYICSGALLFHRLENWTLLEGSYFCFTSLGTIGFGDLYPGRNADEYSLCACAAYILTGMALVAMCFSLVQDEHNSLPRKANFQRNTPTRRSAGAEPLIEYFVPRSISEFDLSLASGDTPIAAGFLPLTVRAPRKLPPNGAIIAKQKEKMVTFEDELALRRHQHAELQDVFM